MKINNDNDKGNNNCNGNVKGGDGDNNKECHDRDNILNDNLDVSEDELECHSPIFKATR